MNDLSHRAAARRSFVRASVAQLATALTALLVFSAGAAVVLGLTHYLITSQAMDDAHALKAYTIAGGIIAGGAFLPFMHGKAKALLIIGIVAAEAFNIGLIAETTWRERAAAHAERAEAHKRDVADHAARVKARADAEARLTRSESAADAKEQARAADASKRDCKRECMAGHLEAVTAARAEVSAARNALLAAPDAHPHPPQLPPETDMPLGQHWDLVMAVLSSIGGNLIAIGLFSFAGALVSGASDAHPHPRRAAHGEPARDAQTKAVDFQPLVPQIIVADSSAADPVSAFEAARLRTMLANPLPDLPGRTVADVIAGRRGPDKPPKRGPDRPKTPDYPRSGGLSKADALDDVMQRLADGRTIQSQDELAEAWNRPKQTVSDWMREWRRIGIIPQPVQSGRCKVTAA